jgi:hypothetical protein
MQNRGSLLGFRNEASMDGGESMGRGKAQSEGAGNVGAGRSLMAAGALILLMAVGTAFWLHPSSGTPPVCSVQASGSSLFPMYASTPAVTTAATPAFLDVRVQVLKKIVHDSKKSCNIWPEIPNISGKGKFCVAC